MRCQLCDGTNRISAIARLADNLYSGILRQQFSQARPEQGVIVDDENALSLLQPGLLRLAQTRQVQFLFDVVGRQGVACLGLVYGLP
jgi:hypothetical protein